MKLLFVRHGETDWNKKEIIQGSSDTDLNETGIKQAKELGKELRNSQRKIQKIYTSKQKRAHLTAKIIGRHLGVPVFVLDGLEELNLGKWEGLSWVEVKDKYPKEYEVFTKDRRYTVIPEGESYQMMLDRLLPAIKQMHNDNVEDILVVTHSAVIRGLLTYLSKEPFEEMMKFKIPNLSVSEVDASLVLESLNENER